MEILFTNVPNVIYTKLFRSAAIKRMPHIFSVSNFTTIEKEMNVIDAFYMEIILFSFVDFNSLPSFRSLAFESHEKKNLQRTFSFSLCCRLPLLEGPCIFNSSTSSQTRLCRCEQWHFINSKFDNARKSGADWLRAGWHDNAANKLKVLLPFHIYAYLVCTIITRIELCVCVCVYGR